MVNARNLGRRARRDAVQLLSVLDKMRDDEEFDEGRVRAASAELASKIDSDWASIVLLALWNTLREPEEAVRPHVKRALELLNKTSAVGSSRALTDVAELISSCWLTHEAGMIELAPFWESAEPARTVKLVISGHGLPTAVDAQTLMSDPGRSLAAIAEVLLHDADPAELFPPENFPHLSQLPASGEAISIWEALFLRVSVIMRLVPFEPDLAPLSEQFSIQIHSESGKSRVLAFPEIRSLLINHEEDITAYPVVELSGVFWSSSHLLADSLAPWLLAAIQRTKLRERVISQPFEDKVVELLRAHGFKAGSVDEKGTWRTQVGQERLYGEEDLPGQIDVLASRHDSLFVLECKSIFSMGRIRNIAEKLGPETHDWRGKLQKKRDWSKRALGREVDLSMIIIEGVDVYASEAEAEAEIPLVTFEFLSGLLDAAKELTEGSVAVQP